MLGNVPSAIPGTMGTRTVSEKAGGIFTNGWGCDQFGSAGLGIYPTLKLSLRADPLA